MVVFFTAPRDKKASQHAYLGNDDARVEDIEGGSIYRGEKKWAEIVDEQDPEVENRLHYLPERLEAVN